MQFKTSDIVLAATLKVKGAALADIEMAGTRGIFVFADVDSALLQAFDLGELVVEPNTFHQAVKQLTTAVRRKQG